MEIFIVGGPNGSGKSSLSDLYIPKNVEYINSDLISQVLKEQNPGKNVQEIAQRMALDKLNSCIAENISVGFESNLADLETYKWLVSISEIKTVKIAFITAPLEICQKRVQFRFDNNLGHFVRPDIVRQRHEAGMDLLAYYLPYLLNVSIYLNDKHGKSPGLLMNKRALEIKIFAEIPDWFSDNLKNALQTQKPEEELTKEEIIKRYKESIKKSGA